MTTVAVAGMTAINLVAGGFLLGIGFWGSKKLTTYWDMRLALRSSNVNQLAKEYPYVLPDPPA